MKINNYFKNKFGVILNILKRNNKNVAQFEKKFDVYVKNYRELRGDKKGGGEKGGEEKEFKFNKNEYKEKFKNFVKILKENNYEIDKKNILLTIGEYPDNKRKIFEGSGFSNLYKNNKNKDIFENDYVHWTVMPDAINFDIAKDIVFTNHDSNFESSGFDYILKSILNIKENSKISSIIIRLSCDLFFNSPLENDKDKKERIQSTYNNYFKILTYINKKFSFKIPIYILLSEAEDVYGFESFLKVLSEEEKNQVFGVSNQNQVDEEYTKDVGKKIKDDFKNIFKQFFSQKHG